MIKNILLVDESVPDYEVFLHSVNEFTKAVPYSATTTYEQLRQAIPGPVDQLGIVFVKGAMFLGQPFTEQYDFFQSLVQQFEIKHLDFLGCDTLDEWKTFYDKFTNVVIGASNNKTGNLQYGGDWTMESSAEDVEGIYFTKSIEYYKYLLDVWSGVIFFTKNTGDLYGMGQNADYQLGKNHNKFLTEPTEVFMKDSSNNLFSINGIQKIRSSNRYLTLFQKDNKLYGFGVNTNQCLNSTANAGVIYYNPIEVPLPIAGTIQDFIPTTVNGEMYLFIIVGGRLYAKNVAYTEITTGDANAGMATLVYGDGDGMSAVFNNEVYRFTGLGPLTKLTFPGDATGTVTHLKSTSNLLYVVRGGTPYYRSGTQLVKPTIPSNPTVNLNSVTDIAIDPGGNVALVNNNILYQLGYRSDDGEFFCGTTLRADKVVPTPAGTITSISLKGGYSSIAIVVGGTAYVSGRNEFSMLGGYEPYYYGFRAVQNTTNVTMLERGLDYCVMVMNNKLYTFGYNQFSSLGTPKLATIETAPIPIQLDGVTLNTIDRKVISSAYEFTWLGIGEKLYCSGTNWNSMAGLNQNAFASKFVEIPVHTTASGPITFVSVSYVSSAIVKGNKIYAAVNADAAFGNKRPLETQLRPINFPAGITGTIKGLCACNWGFSVLIDDALYGFGMNRDKKFGDDASGNFRSNTGVASMNTLVAIKYQGVPITGVTKFASGDRGTLCLRNGQLLYAGYNAITDTVFSDFTNIPIPSDASGNVERIESGNQHFCVIIGGVLYGLGDNTHSQLGSGTRSYLTLSKVFTNGNTTPITDVTDVICGYRNTYITRNNTLYGIGENPSGQLGTAPNPTSNLTLISTGIMGLRMTVTSSSTFNDRNYGPNGTTYKIVGELLSKIDYVQFGVNRVYKASFISVGATSTFAVPNGSGTVVPVITDTDGNTYTLAAFNYSNPMVLQALSTSTGKPNQILRIRGVLSTMTSVKFGTVSTTSITSIGNNEYSVVIPEKGAQTAVTVRVLDTYGTESNAIPFTYLTFGITAVTNLSDQAITQAVAGERIKLLGSNLTPNMTIWFGTKQVTTITNVTPTSLTVMVPNVVGDVKLRCYDTTSNFAEYAPVFTCKVAATTLATSTAVITYSTSIGPNLYYARTDKTIVRVINRTFQVVYTHENDIYGLANANDPTTGIPTLYFGDRTTRKIYSLNTTLPFPLPKVDFYSDATMNPMAMKILNGNMFVACANSNDSISPAVLKISMSTKAKIWGRTYAGLESYQLRGLTLNTSNMTDSSIYLSAVPFVGGVEANITQGRVIKLDASGTTQNIGFITGINNPKDLSFLAGYLVVDGNLEFYTPDGNPVSSFSTNAGTIVVDGNTAYFTSDSGVTSDLNQLTVETYVDPGVLSIREATPLSGPQGTLVFIGGTLMVGNIVKVEVNGVQLANTEYWISNILLTVRMPTGSGQATIRVTYGANLTKDFVFNYVNSDITNVIPLYSQDVKRFHFTGNYLNNIVYVAFVDTQTTTVTASNRKEVYNVTDTSFDCSFEIIPVNSTRILLLDAYGNTTQEDAATFTLSSETCFVAGTPVLTDQGLVAIEKIDPEIHTLHKKEIRAITKIRYTGDSLVLLEQDSLRRKYPTRDTVISRKHKIYYKGKMKTAESLVGHHGVRLIPYDKQFLYNVLLHTHETMNVNGLICETLHPKNPIVKYFI